MDHVRFRLLGPMEITVGAEVVAIRGSAERALLAQLVLSPGRVIPATTLIDRLWAESSLPVNPMNALQIRVSKLRRGLSAAGLHDMVVRDGVGYRAEVSPSAVDAVEFVARVRTARAEVTAAGADLTLDHLEAYDAALALWRGEPLADFTAEQWAMVEAGRLTELRLAAISERAKIALALGRHRETVEQLEPLVAAEPTRESLAGMLMVALWRVGRQTEALAVFTRTRTRLQEELGLEPSAALRSLHERVLRHDESLGVPDDLVPPAARPPNRAGERDGVPLRNLPALVRPLIGRDAQVDAVGSLAGGVRVLTMIGPGGAGKTSLALAIAHRIAANYPDGAVGVWLSSVNDAAQVPLAVAEAIGVPLDGAAAGEDIRERIMGYLAHRRMLLLVDNCEHLIDEAASLLHDMVGRCTGLTVLATSREALAIPDEVQVSVGPLDTAPEGTPESKVLSFPASQLLIERARAVRPGMVLTAVDLLAVGRISRALDGLPLALELAAARVSAMSLAEIADGLTHRFSLLTSGTRTAESRQRTLRATVDWSYALLSDRERFVFNRLAVFHGSWTLAAAEAVVGAHEMAYGAVLDTVGRLVERSMVVAERGPTTRYRLLETLRQYAMERLIEEGQRTETARSHANYYRQLTRQAEKDLRGHRQAETFRLLRDDQANIRAALNWFSGAGGALDAALEMAGSLGLFWHLGRHLEGREVLRQLLAATDGAPGARARALQAVSLVERPRACLVHPSPRCAEAAQESLAVFEQVGDASRAALSRVLVAVEGVTGGDRKRFDQLLDGSEEQFDRDGDSWGKAVIGFVRMEAALKQGDEAAAVRIGRETSAAFRDLADPWGLSAVLYHLGWGLRQFGRYQEGARVLEEAIDVASGAGLHNTAQWALGDLGLAYLHLGDAGGAREAFDRARASSDHIGDGAGAVLADYGYGLLAQVQRDWTEARRLFTNALEGFRALCTPVSEGMAMVGLAHCAEAEGDVNTARHSYQQALRSGRTTGEPGLAATALEGLGRLAKGGGEQQHAHKLLTEAATLRATRTRPAAPHERIVPANVAG